MGSFANPLARNSSVGVAGNQFFSALPGMQSQGDGNPSGVGTSPQFPNLFNNNLVTGGTLSLPTQNPYQVPQQTASGGPYNQPGASAFSWPSISGTHAVPPQYGTVANNFANWLTNQIGQGVTPYNLSTPLPTGGKSQPGQLTAGENPMLTQLQSFLSGKGGSTLPGASTLSNIANQGISALPEWQSMVAQMQQGMQTGEANLREQFAGMGDLAGSPFGTAMQQYQNQYGLDINSLLGQLQQTNILQGQIPVAQGLTGMESQMAPYLQSLNQQAIQNQYGEFVRTSPDYNPLVGNIQGMAGIYPPTVTSGQGVGTLGGLLGGAGGLMGGGASLISALGIGGGSAMGADATGAAIAGLMML